MAEATAAQQLMENLRGKTLIMGIGNPMRGDDVAGPRLIELLQESKAENLLLIDAGSAPERHLGEIEAAAPESILLVDAVDWGGATGEVAFFDEESLPQRFSTTHDVSLRLIMQYIREQTGVKVGLVGIQPEQTAFGTGLSAPVEDAVKRLAECLSAEPFKANLTGVSA
ncbi:MAG: hydrogenase maturation protease [Armatimonadetes bacterium]|nr:hydrogenase maturation protease [Armatimonadota bacterium]NIO74590.1 hydrogenase maturation protease [Armatimonadota bacterium]NIO96545.1 hydrogenase maturation protease [Armatimonadota bacterium]